MDDALTDLLTRHGLGPAERALALKGVAPPDGPPREAWLCLLSGGAALALPGGEGEIVPLTGADLRWEAGLRKDQLIVDGQAFLIPLGASGKAKEIVALGRIHALGAPGALPDPGRYVEPGAPLYEAWLRRALTGEELALAWLPTADTQLMASPLGPDAEGGVRLLLTSHRALLVALSDLGDVWRVELPRLPLEVEARLGRDRLVIGPHTLRPPLRGEGPFRELAPSLGLGPEARMVEVARLKLRHGGEVEAARRLLDHVVARSGLPVARLGLALLEARAHGEDDALAAALGGPEGGEILKALAEADPGGGEIAGFAEGWALSPAERGALVARLMEAEAGQGRPPAAALPLHEATHGAAIGKVKDPVQRALMDIALAEHRLLVGDGEGAQLLLEARLKALPDETLEDLLPPAEADLTKGAGGQLLRVRILELLVQARGPREAPDAAATAELARLQPLVADRLTSLIAADSGPLGRRAAAVLALLEGPGLLKGPGVDIPLKALPAPLLEERLPHPATRETDPMAALQGWLGKARLPDRSALRAYSDRLTRGAHPAAADALADALLVLGLPASIEAFISRGEMSVGIRAYGGPSPFLLIGVEHLTEGSDHHLSPAELSFGVGAELCHLRLGHTRLTASEVWDGIIERGGSLIDAMGALLGPLGLMSRALTGLTSVGHLHKAGRLLQKHLGIVQAGADGVASVMGVGHKLRDWTRRASPPEDRLARMDARDELLAFCRSLQLTADRAGLLLCGDVGAATRAILLTSRRLGPVLDIANRHGLATATSRRGEGGAPLEQELALRLAALYAFYLSEDYTDLRGVITGQLAPEGEEVSG